MAEPTTVIGEFTSVRGTIRGEEDLLVRGRVEGEIQLEGELVVDGAGVVKADVTARAVDIAGVVVGNVTASERVHLEPDCRVVGDLSAPSVSIDESALYRGRIDMVDADVGATPARAEKTRAAAKPAPRRVTPSRTAPKSPARQTTRTAAGSRAEDRSETESQKAAPEPKVAVMPARRRSTRGKATAKVEVPAEAAASDAPPPKPRVAPKKRRVSVRKKR